MIIMFNCSTLVGIEKGLISIKIILNHSQTNTDGEKKEELIAERHQTNVEVAILDDQ